MLVLIRDPGAGVADAIDGLQLQLSIDVEVVIVHGSA